MKPEQSLMQRWILSRAWILKQWTRIPEKKRESFWKSLVGILNYLGNALLLAIPVSILTHLSFWKSVLCLWVLLPFIEHYHAYFREDWRGNPPPEQ